ncbi:hypothetical protein IMSAGC018_01006 [Lachnospiraceae bacterium]|nr:hypothetical protein IMSAGC018_01006 [Lachnospiraceae bacterium]
MNSSDKFAKLRDKEWIKKVISVNNSIEADEEENNFYLHSYLKYLQAEDNGFDISGVRGEAIANFTKELLENETIAAELVQKDIYNILTKKMELAEEDFESLFN